MIPNPAFKGPWKAKVIDLTVINGYTQFFSTQFDIFSKHYFPTENQEPELQGKMEDPMDR